MKFVRLGPAVGEHPAVLAVDASGIERTYSLESLTGDIDGAFLASGGVEAARRALEACTLPELAEADQLRIGAPIARPGSIICIGMNYAAHAAESGAAPPRIPVVFLKPANTIAGPYDAAPIPPGSAKYDWEVELGVVIGRAAVYLASPEDAAGVIAGYVLANDLSERAYQIPGEAGQWTKGKSLPASTPVGPWLVPATEVDPAALGIRSRVNGEVRQDSKTTDMLFDPAVLVHHLSQYMLLEPGDLILTGTPEGVALSGRFPYLAAGDVAELEIDGLGIQRQEFFSAVPAAGNHRGDEK
ncbi:fumarylacetoacetate hydrolase family protein [Arthrobacter sp. BL-252-APC-1A]|uniref:fumarylacetoacetate hydrolase family protein n=1 Tax=Arthrobacter sp. BL-252-APC-1A TaxID=2606622 RepID=UPI0012B42078|nr:fumarylacetoacetate hydrolase family protein [Arthrobacter sp. BL-252-APC-1A]MSS00062.1 fumarylacetoacetate hydrolase family protein [Arthrobacter sp. BL-252-APC-1A]